MKKKQRVNTAIDDNSLPRAQSGFSIIEVMVATTLLSFVGLGLVKSAVASFNSLERSVRHSLATELVLDKMEEFAATDPSLITSVDDEVDFALTQNDIDFQRTTTVTVNADSSRTIAITVTCTNANLPCSASFSNTFAPWGAT